MPDENRYRQAKKVTLIGAAANFLLAILKVIFGIFGHSQALFADGIHSFSDMFTDFLVIMAAKAGSHAPDQEHPYGHGRIETIMSSVLSILLLVVGFGIIFDAVRVIIHPAFIKPAVLGLIVAILSIAVNEWLFRYTFYIGKKINSNLLNVNAWHHRGDAFSSFVVLIGMSGSILGIHYLDSIAAIVVALMIVRMGIKMLWQSAQELIDTAANEATVQKIHASIAKVAGVLSIHQVRTRLIGGMIFVEVHVLVDPHISVSEGHYVANQVIKWVQKDVEKVVDVLVHVDPEDDVDRIIGCDLPSRKELRDVLQQHWQNLPGYNTMQRINFHYLSGKVEVELFLPLSTLENINSSQSIVQQYQEVMGKLDYIDAVTVWFGCKI